MRIVVVSAGAIGGYFGGRLLELVATSPSLCAHGAPPSRSRSTTCCALAPRRTLAHFCASLTPTSKRFEARQARDQAAARLSRTRDTAATALPLARI
jgi:ketopantoate reductase